MHLLVGCESLGLELTENTMGTSLTADSQGLTSVPGVWAAGNIVNPSFQVIEAAAHGARVAMNMNTQLVFARADTAVALRNEPFSE